MEDTLQSKVEKIITLVEGLSTKTTPTSTTPTIPTLVYFDVIGIAWPIRCLLHLHNIDYNFIAISIQQWTYKSANGHQPLKSAFNNGHVPLYIDQGVNLNQSNLILIYLAQQTRMMGDNKTEALAIESVLLHCYDAVFHSNGLLSVNITINIPAQVVQARLDAFMGQGDWGLVTNGYHNHLNAFVKLLEANELKSGFMVGSRLSVADLSAFNILCNWYKAFDKEVFLKEFPILDTYIQRIALIPGISDYIRNKQEATTWFDLPSIALKLTSSKELEGLVGLSAEHG
ncbi:MAG: glutathione S-transferase [Saccharospirillaceae bacterium]|nr:glutathione S-transferase [Pseudomonadales bacterium]NRB81370.1 glutathione S-transferase [Saccharospirillaceae bacterium]